MKKILLSLLLLPVVAQAQCDYILDKTTPQTRTDNIPECHVMGTTDEYLSGYLQSLVDTNYCEFEVRVVVEEGVAYLYNLPCNELIAQSIMCFIEDVPYVCGVVRVDKDFYAYPPCYHDVCNSCTPCCGVNGIWFPQSNVLFAPLIADPRQVTNSAAIRFNDNIIGKHVGAVSFGDEFPFFRWFDVLRWHGDLEIGIEAGIFAVFDMGHEQTPLVNTDFFVAFMTNYAINKWSYRLRVWHLSSHLGDEFLLCNPGYDRRNLSDEGIDIFASYQICRPIRLYAGFGDIVNRDKSFPEKPYYFEFGTEIRVFGTRECCAKLYFQPFLAMNFRTWQEHNWNLDQTYCLGIELAKIQGIGKKARFFAEYHNGYSVEGQFLRCRTSYSALRFTYGY